MDGDVVSEASEFGDESVCALFGVVAGVEVVLAEFVVLDVVCEDVPDDHEHGVGDGEYGFRVATFPEPTAEPTELCCEVPLD